MSVVVIVPAFAVADQTDENIVATILVRLVIPVAPNVGDRIYRPGNVPAPSAQNTPDQNNDPELKGHLIRSPPMINSAASPPTKNSQDAITNNKPIALQLFVKLVARLVALVGAPSPHIFVRLPIKKPTKMPKKKFTCADLVAHPRADGAADESRPTAQACPEERILQGSQSCVQSISGKQSRDASASGDNRDRFQAFQKHRCRR